MESLKAATAEAHSTFSGGTAGASDVDCPAKVALEFASVGRNMVLIHCRYIFISMCHVCMIIILNP